MEEVRGKGRKGRRVGSRVKEWEKGEGGGSRVMEREKGEGDVGERKER